jgi:hypothetical protein
MYLCRNDVMKKIIIVIVLIHFSPICPEVGSIVAGQSLWWISQRIGQTADIIESKIDALAACPQTSLSFDDIVGDQIVIDAPGIYCLSEDLLVSSGISIQASCVFLDLNNRRVDGFIQVENSVSDVVVTRGFVFANFAASTLGISVASGCSNILFSDLTVKDTAASNSNGATGMVLSGSKIQVLNCTIQGGDAAGTSAFVGGNGITIDGDTIIIRDCVVSSGAGGDINDPTGTAGAAGHGINITGAGAVDIEIDRCLMYGTGAGGNNTNGVGGTGGAGGHGIAISADPTDVAVHDCVIRNTGAGGTGVDANGAGGKAVEDLKPAGAAESIIYRNVAHNIANTVKYDLQAGGIESGVFMPNPPPNTTTIGNQFVNLFYS